MDDMELLDQWISDFKQAGHRIPDILKKARHSSIELVLELVSIVVVFPAVIAFAVYQIQGNLNPISILIGVFAAIILGVSGYLFFRLRIGAWKTESETPRALLALLKKQEAARLKELRYSKVILFIVTAFVTVFVPVNYLLGSQKIATTEGLVRLAICCTVLVGCFIFCRLWKRRKERAMEVIADLERSFIS
ncbi:MAG: hypothetical protein GY847_00305 [Proteobacteria bacterium]|nr:hypothetical protein [Pseudomonadota bacterium]